VSSARRSLYLKLEVWRGIFFRENGWRSQELPENEESEGEFQHHFISKK
jgi:hypothetical protein